MGIRKLFCHMRLHVPCKQREGTEKAGIVSQLCSHDLNLSPRRPRVGIHISLNVRKYEAGAAHNTAPHHDAFGIIRMD